MISKKQHTARSMVTEYGMSKKLGMVSYEGDHQVFIGRDYGQTKTYSEATAVMIDDEVRRILGEAYDRAKEAIETHREQHKAIAEALLKYETLDAKQIMSLFKTGKMKQRQQKYQNQKHLKNLSKMQMRMLMIFQTLISIMVMKKQILNQKKIRKNQKMKQPNKAVFLFFYVLE